MEKFILVLLLVPILTFSQSSKMDSLEIVKNQNIASITMASELASSTFNQLLKDDNFKNRSLQKTILDNFNEKQTFYSIDEVFTDRDRVIRMRDLLTKAFQLKINAEERNLKLAAIEEKMIKEAVEFEKAKFQFLRESGYDIDELDKLNKLQQMDLIIKYYESQEKNSKE